MLLYCLFGTTLCISPEAWAGWAQTAGAILAIGGTAWAVQRSNRLQLLAERAREFRQMALDAEAIEFLFSEAVVELGILESSMVDVKTFEGHMSKGETRQRLAEIVLALELVKPSVASKPHYALAFMRGLNACLGGIEDAEQFHGLKALTLTAPSARLRKSIADIGEVIQRFREDREAYRVIASNPSLED